MNIVVSGGTGFVGRQLTRSLVKKGHHVYILTRSPDKHENTESVNYIGWLKEGMRPAEQLPSIQAVVNLAGESLNSGRWTGEKKEAIKNSRIEATEGILHLLEELDEKPDVLINASAVGYYGMSRTKTFTEETTDSGNDFLANVVEEWETTAAKVKDRGVRAVFLRFGVILGEEGALPKMVLPYKMMVGGKIGSGEQWMSWVHIDDVVGLIEFSITHPEVEGPVNATAPQPKRNKDFGKTISEVMNRPHWFPVPGFVLRTALGDMSNMVLKGQSVIPEKATEYGYTFHYPELKQALESILTK